MAKKFSISEKDHLYYGGGVVPIYCKNEENHTNYYYVLFKTMLNRKAGKDYLIEDAGGRVDEADVLSNNTITHVCSRELLEESANLFNIDVDSLRKCYYYNKEHYRCYFPLIKTEELTKDYFDRNYQEILDTKNLLQYRHYLENQEMILVPVDCSFSDSDYKINGKIIYKTRDIDDNIIYIHPRLYSLIGKNNVMKRINLTNIIQLKYVNADINTKYQFIVKK